MIDIVTSLTIPEGVKTIGKKAFYNCSAMTALNIPISVKSIGELSFEGCSKLQNITVPSGSGYFASEGGVLFNFDKSQLVCYPQGKAATSQWKKSNWACTSDGSKPRRQ